MITTIKNKLSHAFGSAYMNSTSGQSTLVLAGLSMITATAAIAVLSVVVATASIAILTTIGLSLLAATSLFILSTLITYQHTRVHHEDHSSEESHSVDIIGKQETVRKIQVKHIHLGEEEKHRDQSSSHEKKHVRFSRAESFLGLDTLYESAPPKEPPSIQEGLYFATSHDYYKTIFNPHHRDNTADILKSIDRQWSNLDRHILSLEKIHKPAGSDITALLADLEHTIKITLYLSGLELSIDEKISIEEEQEVCLEMIHHAQIRIKKLNQYETSQP